MPRVCTVCTSGKRAEIDALLVSGECVKRDTARRYGLDKSAICRHAQRHLDPALIDSYKQSLEAERDSSVRTAKQNCQEFLADLRQCREAFVANGRLVPHQDFLEILDRAIKANEQYGRITKEISGDQITALYVELGVRDKSELSRALDLSRAGQNLSLEECREEALELLRIVLQQKPEWRTQIVARLDGISTAEVVEPLRLNGGNGAAP